MEQVPMKILILEDDAIACNNFLTALKNRKDFELSGITDSDIEAMRIVRSKRPEGIILDIELNNSVSGNIDSFEFLAELNNLNLGYKPVVIVTTHIKSNRTYEILHEKGAEIVLFKNHPKYSSEHVLNKMISLRNVTTQSSLSCLKESLEDTNTKISELIYTELDLIGVTQKLKGRNYIHDAIFFVITNDNSNISPIQHVAGLYKKSETTITNGIKNAINHAWRVSAIEDLLLHYKAKVNIETGVPTPMEFIYYYIDKIKKSI